MRRPSHLSARLPALACSTCSAQNYNTVTASCILILCQATENVLSPQAPPCAAPRDAPVSQAPSTVVLHLRVTGDYVSAFVILQHADIDTGFNSNSSYSIRLSTMLQQQS